MQSTVLQPWSAFAEAISLSKSIPASTHSTREAHHTRHAHHFSPSTRLAHAPSSQGVDDVFLNITEEFRDILADAVSNVCWSKPRADLTRLRHSRGLGLVPGAWCLVPGAVLQRATKPTYPFASASSSVMPGKAH